MPQQKRLRQIAPIKAGHRQRGATLIFVAFFLMVLVITLGLAIEVGRLYSAQSQLQKAANMAVLQAAPYASGCVSTSAGKTPISAATNAILHNIELPSDSSVTELIAQFDPNGVVKTKTLGADGAPIPIRLFASNQAPQKQPGNAVRIRLEYEYNSLFPDGWFGNEVLSASAAAFVRPVAGLRFGTTLANIDPDLLGNLLDINITAADFGTLADAGISLQQLLGLNINAELATAKQLANVTINEALDNITSAISGLSEDLLTAIRDQVGQQLLSKIVGINGALDPAVSLPVYSILNAAAQLAAIGRDDAIQVPLNIELLGGNLADITARLRILQPPKIEIGPAGNYGGSYYTEIYSAGVGLSLMLDLNVLAIAQVHLPLALRISPGVVRVEHIGCPSATERYYTVKVTGQSGTAALAIGTITKTGEINTDHKAHVDLLAGAINIATISNADNHVSRIFAKPFEHPFKIDNPESDLPATYSPDIELRTADLTALLSGLDLKVDLLSNTKICKKKLKLGFLSDVICETLGSLGDILSGVTRSLLSGTLNNLVSKVIMPLVNSVLGPILDPVLDQLGISLGNPTVTLFLIEADQPALICPSFKPCVNAE